MKFKAHRALGSALFAALTALPASAQYYDVTNLDLGGGSSDMQIAGINASQRWRQFLSRAVGSTPLRTAHIVVIGVAVGIAEELLFRAAIQPLVGVTAASLIFAAVHWNYAAPRGSRETLALSALAFVLIFLISVVLGHVFVAFGLGAAIVAHASYDIVVLMKYRQLSAVLRSS